VINSPPSPDRDACASKADRPKTRLLTHNGRAEFSSDAKPPDNMKIFIQKNGRQHGPYSLDEINSKALSGDISPSEPAWIEGWAEWQPLSRLSGFVPGPVPPPFDAQISPPQFPKVERSSKAADAPPAARRGSAATVGTYVAGLSLLAIGFLSQEGADTYHIPRGISVQAAAIIGGACPALLLLVGLSGWYCWFRRERGSVIMLVGLLAAAKGLGALIARFMIVSYLTQASADAVPTTVVEPRPISPPPSPRIETEADKDFHRRRAKSKAEAIALYPDVADHRTPLGKEVDRLIESYKATDDPILYAPDAPMLITLVAARNLGISPRHQK
jgi:hypothetical protein